MLSLCTALSGIGMDYGGIAVVTNALPPGRVFCILAYWHGGIFLWQLAIKSYGSYLLTKT